MMSRISLALIAGGISSEREISLAGGEQVYQALNKTKYSVTRYDPKNDLDRLVADAGHLDAALVILHGTGGEDGTVQGLLDLLKIPYQCSGVLGSALAANKLATKRIYRQAGLPTAPYDVISKNDEIHNPELGEKFQRLGFPLVVKPVCGGSSVGMSIIHSTEELAPAIEKAFANDETVMLEAFVRGRELTGGVIGNDNPDPLPVVEIIPGKGHQFFDYKAKYTAGATEEVCPAPLNETLTRKVQEYARRAHQALFCKGCSRTDMIASDDELFLLETNTIPGMVPTSLLPLAAKAHGFSFEALIDRLIELSLS